MEFGGDEVKVFIVRVGQAPTRIGGDPGSSLEPHIAENSLFVLFVVKKEETLDLSYYFFF